MACVSCFFAAFSKAAREAIDAGWARRDLAGQVRAVASRLPCDDPRAARLRDLALDLELARDDQAAAPAIDSLCDAGLSLEVR
jgi:hypothetical protein